MERTAEATVDAKLESSSEVTNSFPRDEASSGITTQDLTNSNTLTSIADSTTEDKADKFESRSSSSSGSSSDSDSDSSSDSSSSSSSSSSGSSSASSHSSCRSKKTESSPTKTVDHRKSPSPEKLFKYLSQAPEEKQVQEPEAKQVQAVVKTDLLARYAGEVR